MLRCCSLGECFDSIGEEAAFDDDVLEPHPLYFSAPPPPPTQPARKMSRRLVLPPSCVSESCVYTDGLSNAKEERAFPLSLPAALLL